MVLVAQQSCLLSAGAAVYESLVDVGDDFISHPTKYRETFVGCTDGGARVIEAPMEKLPSTGKDRTALSGVVAYSHDVRDVLPQQTANIFRRLARDIDPDFAHCRHRQRIEFFGLDSGAKRLESSPGNVTQVSFRHLAAGRITGAEKQNFWFHRRQLGSVLTNPGDGNAIIRESITYSHAPMGIQIGKRLQYLYETGGANI